ncbi:hypothetical protein MASR1M101_22680 [Gemmatimonas sp.]
MLVQCGDMLRARGWRVLAVVSDAEPVRAWATQHGAAVSSVDALDDATSTLDFDWLFSITHLRLIPERVLQRARAGAVNFHDGPLPRYAGLNAPLWALLAGETSHGISWHRMVAAVDAGEVMEQQLFAIEANDTALSLNARCWEAAVESFPRLLERLAAPALPVAPARPLDAHTMHGGAQRPAGLGLLDPAQSSEHWQRLFRVADTGRYANPFLVPWVWTGRDALVASRATSLVPTETQRTLPVGTVISVASDALTVRVADGIMRLDGVHAADGSACDLGPRLEAAGVTVGKTLPPIDAAWTNTFDHAVRAALVREREWVAQLAAGNAIPAAGASAGTVGAAPVSWRGDVGTALAADATVARERLLAAAALFLARLAQRDRGDIGVATAALTSDAAAAPLLSWHAPMPVAATPTTPVGDAIEAQRLHLHAVRERGSYLQTVHVRYPALAALPVAARRVAVVLGDAVDADACMNRDGVSLFVGVAADGRSVTWHAPRGEYESRDLARLHARLEAFVEAASAHAHVPLALVPLIGNAERAQLAAWGAGAVAPIDDGDSIVSQLQQQAERTPQHAALVCGDTSLTYAELMARADVVARALVARGVGADQRVALLCTRTTELVVGMLGILRAGAAYVPLDPAYPAERVALMLADCGATVVVTQRHLADTLLSAASPAGAAAAAMQTVLLDAPSDNRDRAPHDNAALPAVHGAQLAYVIYTSGSTGRPKGVMVEHRQVVNFFRGMDDVLGATPGVWLAVTSMSFDISVLELLWTLTRGFTVVLGGASAGTSTAAAPYAAVTTPKRAIGFSLFYFSADEQEQARDKYRLLMEGARFADTHGFEAVWTPERHFHAFGGLYPNPSVTSAAVAAITSRVAIRAGSCVLPLHHPARVAEEWSVVDNISGGRVGISFAAGWQPNDFVFRPENYADAKQAMFRDIELVQRLWRGETLPFPGPRGQVEVRTLLRPVQRELPVWITTAGNPDTFEQAGRFGGHLLTHLLGQSLEELAPKIAAYRSAWRAAGHAGEGQVTLMLHTFVGENDEQVRDIVREPMTAYLRTSVGLIKQYAGVFPTLRRRPGSDGSDIDFASLTAEETDALLAFSFERYYTTSALFGSVHTAAAMVDKVRAIGVDEVACLVDFGLDTDTVLAHLPHLDALRAHCMAESVPAAAVAPAVASPVVGVSSSAAAAARSDDESLSALVARHAVTHFQCTPAMARLLLAAPDTRAALAQLDVMCVGGEALSPALANDLQAVLTGRLCNMYGPTETTIWSSVQEVLPGQAVSLGAPIANTTLQVVDADTCALLPIGTPGELLIGGRGVVRGYLDRPELTAERFVHATDVLGANARLYRTGDLVQYTPDGALQFLGRLDHQVKVRGYRIELGEIEAAIAGDAAVQEVVVVAREEVVGDPRLVAYMTARPGTTMAVDALRARLQTTLPEFMVPSQYVILADMPRTPNLKIDRKALPAPSAVKVVPEPATHSAPQSELERTIAGVWCEVLRVPSVGNRDNFFDLGGHSLLVVQVHQRLTSTLQLSFPITDLFRFSSVQAIAAHLGALRTDSAGTMAAGAVEVRHDAPRDDIARRAELRRAAAQRHVRPRT